MSSDNIAITHLALPELEIPVLMASPNQVKAGSEGQIVKGMNSAEGGNVIPGWIGSPFVCRLTKKHLQEFLSRSGRKKVEQQFGAIDEQNFRTLTMTVRLSGAIASGNMNAVRDAAIHYARNSKEAIGIPEFGMAQMFTRNPAKEFSIAMNFGMQNSVMVVWWHFKEKRFASGIYCHDLKSALYVLAMFNLGQKGGIRICRSCGDTYIKTNLTKTWCSPRCRSKINMQNKRKRDKER